MNDKRIARLRELAEAVTKGRDHWHEFTMRIPADLERDADLVLSWAADEIERLHDLHLDRTKSTHKALTERDEKISRLSAENKLTPVDLPDALAENERLESLVHRLQATSMEQAKSGEKLQEELNMAEAVIEEQTAENKRLTIEDKYNDQALDKYWKENKQLIAEVSHYRAALGFVSDLAIKVGAPNVEKLVLSALATGEEIAMRRVLERVSTEQTRTQNGNKDTQGPHVCPGCGGPADNGHDRSIPPNPYYCVACHDAGIVDHD